MAATTLLVEDERDIADLVRYHVEKTADALPEVGGGGLGLPLVEHLARARGSELHIESALGRGTTVSFTLPAGEDVT